MSKVAHNLSRYLKLSVDMLHIMMFSGNIVKCQRHIAHAIRIFETFFWYIHYRTEEGRVHKD